jgi:hypothetical protein
MNCGRRHRHGDHRTTATASSTQRQPDRHDRGLRDGSSARPGPRRPQPVTPPGGGTTGGGPQAVGQSADGQTRSSRASRSRRSCLRRPAACAAR